MPNAIDWLIRDRVVLVIAEGSISRAEFDYFDVQANRMLDSSSAVLVHGIFEHTRVTSIPPLNEMAKLTLARHPRVGWVIIVGMQNKGLRFVLSIVVQALHQRLRFVDTLEDALKFVQYVDTTLPPLELEEAQAIVDRVEREVKFRPDA